MIDHAGSNPYELFIDHARSNQHEILTNNAGSDQHELARQFVDIEKLVDRIIISQRPSNSTVERTFIRPKRNCYKLIIHIKSNCCMDGDWTTILGPFEQAFTLH